MKKEIHHIRKSNPYAYMMESDGRDQSLCGRTVKWTLSMSQAGGRANIEAAIREDTLCRNCWRKAYSDQVKRSVFA